MSDYEILTVTEYGQSEHDPLACTVLYGQTNAHWYMSPGERIIPEIPSASVLVVYCAPLTI